MSLTTGNGIQVVPLFRLYDQAPAIEVKVSLEVAVVMATPSWVLVSGSTPMLAFWVSNKSSETRNAVVIFSNWVRMTVEVTSDGRSLAPVMATVSVVDALKPIASATV